MSKHLRIWLFVLLGTLLSSTFLLAEGVITMTTSKAVGETIRLKVKANDHFFINGAAIKSVEVDVYGRKLYEITNQTITIRGDVTLLDCRENQVTSLDVSKNTALRALGCGRNPLASLDVSKNTALTTLYCYNNQLTSLDVSKNSDLIDLDCSGNQLTSLDLSKNTALTKLDCSYNRLISLNVSGCTALTSLDCSNNQLTSLDVSGCTNLTSISCSENNINGEAMTKLVKGLPHSPGGRFYVAKYFDDKNRCSFSDVNIARSKGWNVRKYRPDGGFTKYSGVGDGIITITTTSAVGEKIMLEVEANGDVAIEGVQEYKVEYDDRYYYYRKELTSQTITIRGDVTDLFCCIHSLTSLDVSGCPSLTKLHCYNSQLTSLDLSRNPALTKLYCYRNKLTSLDLSKNPALTELSCSENKLTSLDLSRNPALTKLYCYRNKLTSLDLSKNPALTELDCSENKLTSLDLTTTAPLVELNCSNNQLTALDVSQNAALTSLACYRNQIKGEAMAQLIKGLPQLQLEDTHLFGIVSNAPDEGNVFLKADVKRVRDKGWSPMRWNEERQQYEPYAGKETETFAVTLTKEGEGTLSATGADDLKAVLYDTELTIEATPATGYELTALTANGTDILATKKVTVKEALEVKATFTKKSFAVKLTKEGEGTITATGADDLTAVPYGTELTIVATPTEGYELISLTAGEEDILATKKVIVTDNVTVKATFDEATFAVSLKKEGEGTISATGAEDLNAVAYGTELTIVATPAEGYELTALTANGTDILATKKIVVKENMTIKATFVDHTGVETTVTQQIQLYPNPTTDYVIVEGVAPASEVTLHSMTGERLYAGRADSRGTLQIDLTPYADGVYLVCVAGETYRVVVRH